MLTRDQIEKRILEIEPAKWYDVKMLSINGFLDEGFRWERHFLHKGDMILGGSLTHYLKGLNGISYDNKDYINTFTLAGLIGNTLFDYLKQSPQLVTTTVFEGTPTQFVFTGKLKSLQYLINEQTKEHDALAILPKLSIDPRVMAYITYNSEKPVEQLAEDTGLNPSYVEALMYKLLLRSSLTTEKAVALKKIILDLGKNQQERGYPTPSIKVSRFFSDRESKKQFDKMEYSIQEAMKISGRTYEDISRAIDAGVLKVRVLPPEKPERVHTYTVSSSSLEKFCKNGYVPPVMTRREKIVEKKKKSIIQSKTEQWDTFRSLLNSPLSILKRDIDLNEPVTKEEEIKLLDRIKNGDTLALNDLVEAHIPFVVGVAQQYSWKSRNLELKDLVQEGVFGLCESAHRWNHETSVNKETGEIYNFQSYAIWWVRSFIEKALARGQAVPENDNVFQYGSKVFRVYNFLAHNFERFPTPEEVAKETNVPLHIVNKILSYNKRILSFDRKLREDEDANLYSVTPDEQAEEGFNEIFRNIDGEDIRAIVEELPDREKEILKLYFGIGTNHPLTLDEIGEMNGFTRERIRQLKEKALDKLRHPSKRRRLEELL